MRAGSNGKTSRRALKVLYDCSKCPGYCCSYDRIQVTKRDVLRIAKHFGLSYKQAETRFTKMARDELVLRHHKDHIFRHVCTFFDSENRRCTIYEARPGTCRQYPETRRCGYYDFLQSERWRQDDEEFIPYA